MTDTQADSPLLTRIFGTFVNRHTQSGPISFFVENQNDSIEQHHYHGKFYEEEELEIISRYYKGGTFVDIGAHVGNHAIYVARILHGSRVIVVEPNTRSADILKINVLLNRCDAIDTRFLGLALASEEGRYDATTPDRNNVGHTVLTRSDRGSIRAVPGDVILSGECVEFIKLNVEGMEIPILKGLCQTLARLRPSIFVEVWDDRLAEFTDWCAENRYRVSERYRRYRAIENYLITSI